MIQIFTGGATFTDEMTDGASMARRFERVGAQLDLIQDLRTESDESIKSHFVRNHSEGSAGKLVACIPQEAWIMLKWLRPDLDHDKPAFYRWLDKHPEYQAYRRRQ